MIALSTEKFLNAAPLGPLDAVEKAVRQVLNNVNVVPTDSPTMWIGKDRWAQLRVARDAIELISHRLGWRPTFRIALRQYRVKPDPRAPGEWPVSEDPRTPGAFVVMASIPVDTLSALLALAAKGAAE